MNHPFPAQAHEYGIYAQNALGRYLDVMESVKNLLNWTHPHRTLTVFAGAAVALVLFCRVKTRWLVLAGGLYEFLYRLLPSSSSTMTIRFLNALKAVPNDHDLRMCYANRAAAHADKLVRLERRRRRRAKLHAIWDCAWEGPVDLRIPPHAFARRLLVLNGRRLLHWHGERDADSGRPPAGQLLLQGHSGLTAPSPTDASGLAADKQASLLAVFGQAPDGTPVRWAVLCADDRDKDALSAAIARACDAKLE